MPLAGILFREQKNKFHLNIQESQAQERKENLRTRKSREKIISIPQSFMFILTCRHLPCSVLECKIFCVAIPTAAR